MTYIDLTFGIAALAAAIIVWLAVRDERVRYALLAILGVLTAGYLGRAFWRDEDEPDPTSTMTVPDPTDDHEETDAEITAVDDALADADLHAHDGAGSNVSDALDLLEEHDRKKR